MGRTPTGDDWSDGPGPFDDDPWAIGPLDDSFVEAAVIREPSADERIQQHERSRALDEQANEDAAHALRVRRRRRGVAARGLVGLFLVVALFTGAVASKWGASLRPVEPVPDAFDLGAPRVETWASTRLPTPLAGVSATPLGTPGPTPSALGTSEFVALQPDDASPVAYDPCRPIRYVVNDRTAPSEGRQLLSEALTIVSRATGLQFVDDGPTEETPSPARHAFQPERYGDRWAPVLIAWTDADETPELADNVLGSAGSVRLSRTDGTGRAVYVTGSVNLDGPNLQDVLDDGLRGDAKVLAVILHELGHLVGLDHVDDPNELMFPSTGTRSSFGPGDRHGLAALGRGSCFADI